MKRKDRPSKRSGSSPRGPKRSKRQNTESSASDSEDEGPKLSTLRCATKDANAMKMMSYLRKGRQNISPSCRKALSATKEACNVPFSYSIDSDLKLRVMTGIPNFQTLNVLCEEFICLIADETIYNLTVSEAIIATLIKLKQNISFNVIAVMFNIPAVITCISIFKEVVVVLAEILSRGIMIGPRAKLSSRTPDWIRSFRNLKAIFVSIEVPLQTPDCSQCVTDLFPHESKPTLKFMIGISPDGLISFVSDPFCGQESDRAIFKQSALDSKLSKNDLILVDEGCMITDYMSAKGVKVVTLPVSASRVLGAMNQPPDVNESDKQTARGHIDRCLKKIRLFKFYDLMQDWNLRDVLKECFVSICGLTNFYTDVDGLET